MNVPDDRAAIIGTLELNTDTAKPVHNDHMTDVPAATEDTCVAGETGLSWTLEFLRKTILQQAKVLFTLLVFIDVHEEII